MMRKIALALFAYGTLLAAATSAHAQFAVIDADAVKGWLGSGQKALLVDVRSPEEYREGHIPGAVNIPAQRVHEERKKFPKDKKAPIIFYCRGVG